MLQPASQNNNQPNQPSILEQAKQGQPEAVAALINRSLKPKGLEATAQRQGDCLQITLSSAQVPNPKATTELIQRGMTILQAEGLRRVKVRSCRSDGMTLAWEQEFTIAAELPIKTPHHGANQAQETISNIANATQPRVDPSSSQAQNFRSAVSGQGVSGQSVLGQSVSDHGSSVRAGASGGISGAEQKDQTTAATNSTVDHAVNPISSSVTNSKNDVTDRGTSAKDIVVLPVSHANDHQSEQGYGDHHQTHNAMANITNINSELTVIHSSIDNVPEYEDIVVRFMGDADQGKGGRKIRCLTTLSELLQVINQSNFPFRGVSQNPAWQYLLETIADCTVTDEQGDQVLRHMMILQPGYTWQPVNLRLVTKVYIESAPEAQNISDISDNTHEGITVDLARSAPPLPIWHDSAATITAAERSVDELTEIPEASTDDTLEDFLNDFIPGVQNLQSASSQGTPKLTPKVTENDATAIDWQVAASTTAEINAITSVAANPSLTDSLEDFLGDFSNEPDLTQPSKPRPTTEVAVRTVRSSQIQAESDDVFGNMWDGDLGIKSKELDPTENTGLNNIASNLNRTIPDPIVNIGNISIGNDLSNSEAANGADASLLAWEVEPTNEAQRTPEPTFNLELDNLQFNQPEANLDRPLTKADENSLDDGLDIGWDVPESDAIVTDPLLAEILAVNVEEPLSSSMPMGTTNENFNQSFNDPLLEQLSAPVSLVQSIGDNGLDTLPVTDTMAADDLFGDFGSQNSTDSRSNSMSSIINTLPIPDQPLVAPSGTSADKNAPKRNVTQIADFTEPVIETITEPVTDTLQPVAPEPDNSDDLFGNWNEQPILQKKKVVETISKPPASPPVAFKEDIQQEELKTVAPQELDRSGNIASPTNTSSNASNTSRNPAPGRKLGPVLANEIAEIMSARQVADTQEIAEDDGLFNDFVFSINLSGEPQMGDQLDLAKDSLQWQSHGHENPPTRLSISGLSDEITL